MPSRSDVLALADRAGILREYRDVAGRVVRMTATTRAALLGAMGFDVSTAPAARQALAELEQLERGRLLPPVSVQTLRPGQGACVEVRCPEGAGKLSWRIEVTLESDGVVELSGAKQRIDGLETLKIRLPADLPLGYHHVRFDARLDGRTLSARQSLILCPQTCWTWREALGDGCKTVSAAPSGPRIVATGGAMTFRSERNSWWSPCASDRDPEGVEAMSRAIPCEAALPPPHPGRSCFSSDATGSAACGGSTRGYIPAPLPGRRAARRKPHGPLGDRRACGLWTHLYTLRSRRNWGIGDLADLGKLAAWGASCGAEFIGLNPLHATANRGYDFSPYSPTSRLFRNPIYLDVERVPEFRVSDRARTRVGSPGFRERLDRVRRMASPDGGGLVSYEHVIQLKEEVLRLLFAEFKHRHMARSSARGREYARYVEAGGRMLEDFATFMALADRHSFRQDLPADWRRWPAQFRDPRSPAVAQFRRRFADDVEFHRYLQFETDRQVEDAHARAQSAGMTLGLYHDLAVGSDGGGFDTWEAQSPAQLLQASAPALLASAPALPSSAGEGTPPLFVAGATMGAPPDPMARDGQDWRFPPLHPLALRETGYEYWIRLLRANMRGGGMLRIDHVMGLFRQYWIPQGLSGRRGGYVRFPSDDLLGILALESRRNRVVVVGEDLGTVPPQVPRELRRRGILSTRVLHFERTRRGAFRAARSMSNHALLVAGTHDLPPLAGFVSGEDIRRRMIDRGLRDSASSAVSLRRAARKQMHERRRDCDLLIRRLKAEGLLPRDFTIPVTPAGEPDASRLPILVTAVHGFLARSPAPLVAVSLDDLAAEDIPLNIPGLPPDSGFCWTRAMRTALENLVGDAGLATRVYLTAPKLRGRQ